MTESKYRGTTICTIKIPLYYKRFSTVATVQLKFWLASTLLMLTWLYHGMLTWLYHGTDTITSCFYSNPTWLQLHSNTRSQAQCFWALCSGTRLPVEGPKVNQIPGFSLIFARWLSLLQLFVQHPTVKVSFRISRSHPAFLVHAFFFASLQGFWNEQQGGSIWPRTEEYFGIENG